jgi:hypothetical protein
LATHSEGPGARNRRTNASTSPPTVLVSNAPFPSARDSTLRAIDALIPWADAPADAQRFPLPTASLLLLAACGGGSGSTDEARERALDRREEQLDEREKQLDERETQLDERDRQAAGPATTTTTAAVTSTTAPSPYPREIPVDSIQDQRIRGHFQMNGASTAVELAPGVYAEKGQGPVGPANRYTSIVGLCSDVNAYEQAHGPRGHTCW